MPIFGGGPFACVEAAQDRGEVVGTIASALRRGGRSVSSGSLRVKVEYSQRPGSEMARSDHRRSRMASDGEFVLVAVGIGCSQKFAGAVRRDAYGEASHHSFPVMSLHLSNAKTSLLRCHFSANVSQQGLILAAGAVASHIRNPLTARRMAGTWWSSNMAGYAGGRSGRNPVD